MKGLQSHLRKLAAYLGLSPLLPLRIAVTVAELACLAFLFGEGGLAALLAGFILALAATLREYT